MELFLSMLQVMFIYLKLTEKITWKWWQVLLPLEITFVLGFIIGLVQALNGA